MSNIVPASSGGLDIYQSAGAFNTVGMEDFDETDLVMPRIVIGHQRDAGVITNSLSGERFDGTKGFPMICLGIVKGRVLWPPEVGETKEDPLCKSYDYAVGFPDQNKPERFPWGASGFLQPPEGPYVLQCGDCKLKDWGSNPAQKEAPWCTEQHNWIILIPGLNGALSPAIMVLQRTGLRGSRNYMSSFAQQHQPMFVAWTTMTLSVQRRGQVDYSVPSFTRGAATEQQEHPAWANRYRRIRDMLRTPRIDVDEVPVNAPAEAPQQQTPVAAPPQTAPSAPSVAPTQTAPQPAASSPAPAPVVQTAPSVPADVAPPAAAPVVPTPAPDVAPPAAAPAPSPAPDVAPPAATPAPAQVIPTPAPAPSNAAPGAAMRDEELPF